MEFRGIPSNFSFGNSDEINVNSDASSEVKKILAEFHRYQVPTDFRGHHSFQFLAAFENLLI